MRIAPTEGSGLRRSATLIPARDMGHDAAAEPTAWRDDAAAIAANGGKQDESRATRGRGPAGAARGVAPRAGTDGPAGAGRGQRDLRDGPAPAARRVPGRPARDAGTRVLRHRGSRGRGRGGDRARHPRHRRPQHRLRPLRGLPGRAHQPVPQPARPRHPPRRRLRRLCRGAGKPGPRPAGEPRSGPWRLLRTPGLLPARHGPGGHHAGCGRRGAGGRRHRPPRGAAGTAGRRRRRGAVDAPGVAPVGCCRVGPTW